MGGSISHSFQPDKTTAELQSRLASAQRPSDVRAYVVAILHGHSQTAELEDGESVVIGRAFPSTLCIDDPGLSRQHARVTRTGREVFVEDLDSRNGTAVDGKPVRRAVVRPGQQVSMGEVVAAVQWVAAAQASFEGMESYDRFVDFLAYEMQRGRHFARSVSLLMLGTTAPEERGGAAHWYATVREHLRPQDRSTVYDDRTLLVLLPETDADGAASIAKVLRSRLPQNLHARAAVATAPTAATRHETLIAEVREAWRATTAREPFKSARAEAGFRQPAQHSVVACDATRRLYDLTARVACIDVPVLIVGETGTGKEVLATKLHAESSRRDRPFRTVNCGAIPTALVESTLFGHDKGAFTGAVQGRAGLFEEATGGTLFLDEIGELGAGAQAALLRVLETGRVRRVGGSKDLEVDVRIVAATHRDLEAMARSGTFRLDLLFRLNTVVLEIPPLRERPGEIAPLVEHFIQLSGRRFGTSVDGIAPDALRALEAFDWPGNVRELRNVIERACVLCRSQTITLEDLSEKIRTGRPVKSELSAAATPGDSDLAFREQVRQFEIALILEALKRAGMNQRRASELLQMPLRTLVHKLRVYDLKKRFDSLGPPPDAL